jgi:hypothetical protein
MVMGYTDEELAETSLNTTRGCEPARPHPPPNPFGKLPPPSRGGGGEEDAVSAVQFSRSPHLRSNCRSFQKVFAGLGGPCSREVFGMSPFVQA